MSKHLQITRAAAEGQPLSKAQKRFNRLVGAINNLRQNIEKTKELDLQLRHLGDERVLPAEKKSLTNTHAMVMALHHNPHFESLTKKEAEKFDAILLDLLSHLLNTSVYQEDEELRKMYEDYLGGEQSFDEIKAEQERMARDMASEFYNRKYGLNLDADDLGNPEKLREKLEAKQAELEAEARQRTERQARRKKSPAQLERETKQAAADAALKKTVKEIYLDLVRHFHPDKERDEAKRVVKTETMKQITAAYEADDHFRLLELQMTLLNDRDNVFASFDESRLNYFNNALQQQVYELEQELAFTHPMNNGNPYIRFFAGNTKGMEQRIGQYLKDLKLQEQQILYTLEMIKTAKGLKTFVKDFELDDDDDFWS